MIDIASLIPFVLGGIVALLLVGVGIFLLVRYFQTRNWVYLATGLVCTLLLPGLLICCLVVFALPSFMPVVYAPPPPDWAP